MPNTGLDSWLGLETESTWGTDAASSRDWIHFVSEGIRLTADRTRGSRSLGKMTPGARRLYNRRGAGDITLDMYYQGAELLLWHLLGGKSVSGIGPYTHVFSPSLASRPAGLTLEIQQGLLKTILTGGKINKLDLSFTQEILEGVFGVSSKHGAITAAVGSPTYIDDVAPEIVPLEETYATRGLDFKLDTVATDIIEGGLNISLPVTENRGILSEPDMTEQLISDFLSAEGSFTREYDDIANFTKYDAMTRHVLEFNYISEAVGPTHATEYEFKVKLYACQLLEAKPPTEGPTAITEVIPFVCEPDSSGNILDVTIVNERVSIS